MTIININTDLLKSNVELSLNEVKNHLRSIGDSAQSLNTSLNFDGSDKIVKISSKITECINRINGTMEWYKNCCSNYDHFSNDSVSDIDSLEISDLKPKDFKI